MAQVRWTPQAADDLEAICLFVARDAPQVAAIIADRILRATDRLANYPLLGRIVPEIGVDYVRELIVSNYRVIYRVGQEEIHLLAVFHGARPLDASKIELK